MAGGDIYTWDKTADDNNDADPDINWAEGQAPGTVNGSARNMMSAQAKLRDDTGATVTTGGSGNAQTATLNTAFAALATGRRCVLKAGFSNTGAATLAINGLTAKAVKKYTLSGEGDVVANDIRAGGIYHFVYDAAANGAAGAWMLLNPTVATPVAATTSASGVVELATDAETQALADTARAVTPSNLAALKAVQADQEAGTATDRFITPSVQHHHPSALKGWVKNGVAADVQASYNVTSVSDTGTGVATVNWGADFSSAHYSVVTTCLSGTGQNVNIGTMAGGTTQLDNWAAGGGSLADPTNYLTMAAGDHA